jgi:transposase-like protein
MVRLQAAQMFEQDVSPVQVARELRVSTKSVYQWRRRWRSGGEAALASRGPGGAVCRLSPAQLAAVLRNRLKSIQYRPELIGGFLAQTGLTLEPQPP